MEQKNYEVLLDSLQTTGIYVIREDNHQILFFNKRVKAIEPKIEIGVVCDDLWPGGCDIYPAAMVKEGKEGRFISYNSSSGEVVDVVASQILWGDNIPAFSIAVTPHADITGYTYNKILRVNLTTDELQVIKYTEERKQQYDMAASEVFRKFIAEGNVYDRDAQRFENFVQLDYLRRELASGTKQLTCTYRCKVGNAFHWHTIEVYPDFSYSVGNQVVMLYVRDVHDIHGVSLDMEEMNIQHQEIIKMLGEMNFGIHVVNLKTGAVNSVRIAEDLQNAAAEGITQWDDLLRKTMQEFFHPASRSKLWKDYSVEGLRQLWKCGERKKEIMCQRMLHGRFRYVSVMAHFYQRDLSTTYAIVALQDVDERVRRDIRQGQQDRRMAAIIKSRYSVMTTVDLETGICERVYLNETDNLKADGIGEYQEYIELALTEIIHEDDIEKCKQAFELDNLKKRAEQVEDYEEETYEFRLNGSGEKWIEEHAIFVRQNNNVIVNIMECDITEKKRKEAEASREKEERSRIISSMSSLFFSTYYLNLENDGFQAVAQEPEVSAALQGVTTWTEALEVYAGQFINPDDAREYTRSMNFRSIQEKLTPEKPFWAMEYRKATEVDGQMIEKGWIRATVILAEFKGGKAVNALYVAQDVTESKRKEKREQQILKEAYDAAMHANASKSEFLSKMSHDIRTPMNAIIGMTAIAGTHLDEPDRVSDCLNKITVSSKHLLSLINEVLDMSKIESGKIDLSEEEFNLSDLIQNLLIMIRPTAEAKGHLLNCHIVKIKHEDVIGDVMRLQQVFMNILGNAVKYTPPGGSLGIEITEKTSKAYGYGCYEFVFKDNGIGMSEEYLQRIFEPFSRAEDSRVSKIEGTGLGMTIALSIVRMMNGEIEIESEEGKGSKFTVTVFLKQQNREKEDMAQFVDLPVLVVDDNQDDCEAICIMLKDLGMKGKWVTNGSDAVESIWEARRKQEDFFAVILDWKMPKMDGLETAKKIRKEIGDEVPIIILSAYDWSNVEAEAKQVGVSGFISKPLFKSKLVYLFKKIASEEKSDGVSVDTLLEQDFTGRRILLVEDNELNREIAQEIIGSTGVTVESAVDGKEALDIFIEKGEGYYDLIFMDIQMPVMNGHEAARAIRKLDRPDAAEIPIIAMTANAFAEDAMASKNAGMNEHIAKPLNIEQLMDCMQRWFVAREKI